MVDIQLNRDTPYGPVNEQSKVLGPCEKMHK